MAVELAQGIVNITPSAEGIGSEIFKAMVGPVGDAAQKAGEEAGKKMSGGLLANVSDTGKKLIAALGLAAVGGLAIKSALDVEDAQNIIARSTGATGKALDGLQESFKNIASSSGASFDVIAKTLSELSQNTGLTGKALESLTSQVVTFNRITKDSPITVDLLTHALAGFNIPGKEMGKVLDELFKISQKTGIPLADLLATLQTAGPIARQFGFSVEFTATLLAQLAKAGLDANQVMPGLKKAFVEFAKEGREPGKALQETLDALDKLVKAGDLIGARQLAVQIFGPKGAGLVDAALAGKLSLQDLGTSIKLTGDGILDTAGKTGTLSGAMGVLKNNLKLALAEFATPALEAANTALRSILPTIKDIGREFATLPDGIKLGIASLIGLVAALGPIGQFAQGLPAIKGIFEAIHTGAQLGAVRVLELADSFKALSLAQVGILAGVVIGAAAVVAAGVTLNRVISDDARHFKEAEEAGKRWAQVTIAGAKATENPLISLRASLRLLTAEIKAKIDSGEVDLVQAHKLGEEYKALQKAYQDTKTAKEAQVRVDKETAKSLREYNKEVESGGNAAGAFAKLTDDAKKAMQGFQDALLAAAGGDIGRQQQLINIAKAQQDVAEKTEIRLAAEADLDKAVAAGGENSLDAYLASLNLKKARDDEAQSTLDLSSAQLQGAAAADEAARTQDTLNKGLLDGTVSYDAEHQRLLQAIKDHPENAAGYQLELDKLDATKLALDGLDGFIANAKLQVDTAEAEANFARLLGLMDRVNSAFAGSPANFGGFGHGPNLPSNFDQFLKDAAEHAFFESLKPHASGGIFTQPQIGLFGEAGPEAILPLNDPARSFQILGATGLLGDRASVQQSAGPLIGELHLHGTGNSASDGIVIAKRLRRFAGTSGR